MFVTGKIKREYNELLVEIIIFSLFYCRGFRLNFRLLRLIFQKLRCTSQSHTHLETHINLCLDSHNFVYVISYIISLPYSNHVIFLFLLIPQIYSTGKPQDIIYIMRFSYPRS